MEKQHADHEVREARNGVHVPAPLGIFLRREVHARHERHAHRAERQQQAPAVGGQRHEQRKTEVEQLLAAQAPRRAVEREEVARQGHVGVGEGERGEEVAEPGRRARSGMEAAERGHEQGEPVQGIHAGHAGRPECAPADGAFLQLAPVVVGYDEAAQHKEEADAHVALLKEMQGEHIVYHVAMCEEYHQGEYEP